MKISVYYDYYDDALRPHWMTIWFGRDKFQWDKKHLYIPIDAPFKRMMAEDFFEDQLSIGINVEDLVVNQKRPNSFGISIDSIKSRLSNLRSKPTTPYFKMGDIEQFVIQMSDIEDVLSLDRNKLYQWRKEKPVR
jgi:hypothetical protein